MVTWDDIKGFLGAATIVAGVVMLALVEVLRRKFASLGSVARLEARVKALEDSDEEMGDRVEKAVHKAVGDLAVLINKDLVQLRREIEQMTALVVSNNDRIADQHDRLVKQEDRVAVIETFGSVPSRNMAKQLTEMDQKLNLLVDRAKRQ